jgi:predicted alpha/beta superfamily hydrolase
MWFGFKRSAFALLTLIGAAVCAEPVTLEVTVPGAPATLFVAGSHAALGPWKPDAQQLTRRGDGVWSVTLDLPAGATIEYKFTQGSWDTVEKNIDGSERANRSIVVQPGGQTVRDTVEAWAAPLASTVVGELKLHERFESKLLGNTRTIRVWLPPGYAESGERLPVLYMHDGQNCFDARTASFGIEWQIDETLTSLIEAKLIEPLIVVAIDNTGPGRIGEYTPVPMPIGGGDGAKYLQMLVTEIKPMIDTTYRTNPDRRHTLIGGSSLGGLISLEAARTHGDVFGKVLAMSPSLWWNDQWLTEQFDANIGGAKRCRIWLDMGTREGALNAQAAAVDQTEKLSAIFDREKVTHRTQIIPEGEHNEAAWARRFPEAIQYLMKPE